MEHNAQNFSLHSDVMDAAINDLADNGPPEVAWDSIAPTVEHDNINATEDEQIMIRNVDSDDDDDNEIHDLDVAPLSGNSENSSMKTKLSTLFEREVRKDIMSNSEYREALRKLNDCQHRIVMFNRHWCKEYVKKMRKGEAHPGFYLYLGGPGGTGKSFIL